MPLVCRKASYGQSPQGGTKKYTGYGTASGRCGIDLDQLDAYVSHLTRWSPLCVDRDLLPALEFYTIVIRLAKIRLLIFVTLFTRFSHRIPSLMDMPQRPPDGDRNRQPGIIVTTILVTVLANIIVGLRMITRKWIIKSIGWDDRTIIGALVSRSRNLPEEVLNHA